MTTPLNLSSSADAAVMALPLRPEDPVSWALVIKIMLVLVILLAMTFVVLRWYSNKSRVGNDAGVASDALACTAVLRLSPKTRVYRVRSGSFEALVTETSHGSSVTVLPIITPSAEKEHSA